jgi:hypothetical protein
MPSQSDLINSNIIQEDSNISDEIEDEIDKIILDVFIPYITYLRLMLKDDTIRNDVKNSLNENFINNKNKINKNKLIEILKKNLEFINN